MSIINCKKLISNYHIPQSNTSACKKRIVRAHTTYQAPPKFQFLRKKDVFNLHLISRTYTYTRDNEEGMVASPDYFLNPV
jgi:hypothetical protein